MSFEAESTVAELAPVRTVLENSRTAPQPASKTGQPTVHIVDDDPEVCRSLKYLIQSAGFKVATYSSARDFPVGKAMSEPGCLILDIRLPGTNGLELQERLAELGSSMPVIIISGYADVPLAVRAMRKGAMDVLEKPFDSSLLLKRVRKAIEVGTQAYLHRSEMQEIQSRIDGLTPREREVMRLVVQGNANKRIADLLGISMKTVEAHRAHVMRKMDAQSLARLVQMVQCALPDASLAHGLGRHFAN